MATVTNDPKSAAGFRELAAQFLFGWLSKQESTTLLLLALVASIGYAHWKIVPWAVEKITASQVAVEDKHSEQMAAIINSQNEERKSWIEFLRSTRSVVVPRGMTKANDDT